MGQGFDAATLLTALDSMEETYRMPLVLFYQRDHAYLEIAEILGVPPGMAMSRLKDRLALLAPARGGGGRLGPDAGSGLIGQLGVGSWLAPMTRYPNTQ